MRVVVDCLPIRGRNSLSIVVEHLLEAWVGLGAGDELHLALGAGAELAVPAGVEVHAVELGSSHTRGRLRAQSTMVPRLCREQRADVLLGVLPTTTVRSLPCPRAVIAWDLRHELRPAQFSGKTRLLRAVSYGIGFRQADAIITISERTRGDLLASRSWLRPEAVHAAPLGGDHVGSWPARQDATPPYALTFGQWSNKNVDLVLDAWARMHGHGDAPALRIVGLGPAARPVVERRSAELGLGELVQALPWLSDAEFRAQFASAALIVFPSDFEGFGLPAVEAMGLGIPLVVSPDPALLEVTGGLAAVMRGWDAGALEAAAVAARATPPERLDAARERARTFTWARTAERTRAGLAAAIDAAAGRR